MKKLFTITATTAMIYIMITSYTTGPATFAGMNCTGSYGSQASCAGSNCHGNNDPNVVVDITVKDLWGNEVTDSRYFPGHSYKIFVSGRGSGNFPKYSFQFSSESEFLTAGNFVGINGNLHSVVVPPAIIVEPFNPLTTNNPQNNFIDSFIWQAPLAGAGKWTVFATALLSNDDGTRFGDKANNHQLSLFPIPASVGALDSKIKTSIYPNPAKEYFTLKLQDAPIGDYHIIVSDMKGRIILKDKILVSTKEFFLTIKTATWASGAYTFSIMNDGKTRNIPIVRL